MSRKLALLIASSVYDDANYSALVAPRADVEALSRVLCGADIGGFDEVKPLFDEPVHTITLEVERFFNRKQPDDLLLLYFSGHGDLAKWGSLYLIGKNTQQGLLASTAISSTFIKEVMDSSQSRRQVLILDCCHSGAFARGAKGSTPAGEHMATLFEGRGRAILTAAGAAQSAWESNEVAGERALSVFTRYLVQGLETGEADRDADGLITLDELYQYVYHQVKSEKPEQKPGKWVENQQGSIVIAKSPRIPRSPPEIEPVSANLHSSPIGLTELSFQDRSRLVERLLACPSIRDRGTREAILKQLRSEVSHAIERNTIDRTDVFNIVNTCLNYSGGLQEFIEIVRFFERDSLTMQQLSAFLESISPTT